MNSSAGNLPIRLANVLFKSLVMVLGMEFILCGTEVGIFFKSPSGKPFSFAKPNLESIANRFLSQNPAPTDNATDLYEGYRQAKIDELNPQLEELSTQLEAEKKRGQMLDEMKKSRSKKWWEAPVDELSEEQAQMLWGQLSQIREKIVNRLHQQGTEPSPSSLSTAAATVNFPFMARTSMAGSSSNHPSSNFGTNFFENIVEMERATQQSPAKLISRAETLD